MTRDRFGSIILVLAAMPAIAHAEPSASDTVRITDEAGRPVRYAELTRSQKQALDRTVDTLLLKAPDDAEEAGCVAGSGLVYCWAFGYICTAWLSPSPQVMCAACVVPSHCE